MNVELPIQTTNQPGQSTPNVITTTSANIETSTQFVATTTQATANINPVKPCFGVCSPCANNFGAKLLRATGDWPIHLGSAKNWEANEQNGLFTFDQNVCAYTLVLLGLKPSFDYTWKVTANNDWKENYGCNGAGNCAFKSNTAGAIRLIVKTTGNSLQLTSDYEVADCGNGICDPGQTCRSCPEDCGVCPPPVCGGNYINHK